MMSNLPTIPTWPFYESDEQSAVLEVLSSAKGNYWTGTEGKRFEEEFATWCGSKHGLCISNGTAALELALRSVGVSRGDEVIVTPRSFLASAASIAAVGGDPIFADIDVLSGNVTAESIRQVVTTNTKAIIVVHLAGWPADMPSIMSLAMELGIAVVEDCAQAHGAEINGSKVGSFGDVSAFSFCQDKIMSTGGEGGMITTNSDEIRDVVWSLRDHGRNRAQTLSGNHPFGFRWTQERIGTNARMTEMQSAIGRRQLLKVDFWVQLRIENAKAIMYGLRQQRELTFPMPTGTTKHSFYRLGALVDSSIRDAMVQYLNQAGIAASVGACPEIYKEKAFVDLSSDKQVRCPNAITLGKQSITFPVHPGVENHVDFIIEQTKAFFA